LFVDWQLAFVDQQLAFVDLQHGFIHWQPGCQSAYEFWCLIIHFHQLP